MGVFYMVLPADVGNLIRTKQQYQSPGESPAFVRPWGSDGIEFRRLAILLLGRLRR
jgi:hypothetical protein